METDIPNDGQECMGLAVKVMERWLHQSKAQCEARDRVVVRFGMSDGVCHYGARSGIFKVDQGC